MIIHLPNGCDCACVGAGPFTCAGCGLDFGACMGAFDPPDEELCNRCANAAHAARAAAVRIDELLAAGTRHIDAARAARRDLARARLEIAIWKERAMVLAETLRRIDPSRGEP